MTYNKIRNKWKIKQLMVVHKHRLTKIGHELIEDLIKEYSNGDTIVLDKKSDIEPEEELVKDVLTMMKYICN